MNCGPEFCGTVPVRRLALPRRRGREGSVLGQLAGTASHRPRCGPRDDIDVVQTLLGHCVADFHDAYLRTPGTGKTAEAVVARARRRRCDTDRLANAANVTRVTGRGSNTRQARALPTPERTSLMSERPGEIMKVCRKLCGVMAAAAGISALAASRWIISKAVE